MVEAIPRWDLVSRVALIEDTYFTKSDAENMEARTMEREARTIEREDAIRKEMLEREDALRKNMMGFTLFTVGIGQIVPVLGYFKANGMKLPWQL